MSNRCTHLRPKGDSGPGPPAPRHPARTSAPSELPPNRTLRTAPSEPPRHATGYGLRVRSTDNTDPHDRSREDGQCRTGQPGEKDGCRRARSRRAPRLRRMAVVSPGYSVVSPRRTKSRLLPESAPQQHPGTIFAPLRRGECGPAWVRASGPIWRFGEK